LSEAKPGSYGLVATLLAYRKAPAIEHIDGSVSTPAE
jgi:hypothetical protein